MSKKFIAAVTAGSITMLLVGAILYGLVFVWLFDEGAVAIPGVMKESPSIPWILGGQLAFGLLVALVVEWRKATTFSGGAWTGVLLGFLMAIGYDFAQFGTTNLWTIGATLLDPFITALLVGSGGGVIGFVLGHGSSDRE
ncbi:hypothetical protein GF356_05590 [candidate division GN15 bacterium]|nr:hypothetical protein [candidate division GN15 bacterium]